jgi:hypothetical protein
MFVDGAFTLSIAELVCPLAPALAWPVNIYLLAFDVSLIGGQLLRSGGISMKEPTSYEPPTFIHKLYTHEDIPRSAKVVRIADDKTDSGSLTHSNPPFGGTSTR